MVTFFRLLPILGGVLLIAAAFWHQNVPDAQYTRHWIIRVEFLLLIFVVLCLLVQSLHAFGLLLRGQWGELLLTLGLLIVTFVLLLVGLGIDSETLINMT